MLKNRFRKYLPVVVDIETGGFDPEVNAILEIAITLIEEKENKFIPGETFRHHIQPFEGSIVEKESLEFTKIQPFEFEFSLLPQERVLEKTHQSRHIVFLLKN